MNPDQFFQDLLEPIFTAGQPLLWTRHIDGTLKTNVPWIVRHHSPTGFEIGFAGSGPGDLALNAMAALFPIQGDDWERDWAQCWDGKVSRQAWLLHQDFKFRFLASNPDRQSGRIEWEEIEQWLQGSDNE